MAETVKATYALQPETVEDLDRLGELYRWSRAKTIEGLVGFYVRVQHAIESAEVECKGIEWNRIKRCEQHAEGDGEPYHDHLLIEYEALQAEAVVLRNLIAEMKSGLVPRSNYRGFNAGKTLLEDEARREAERKGKKR